MNSSHIQTWNKEQKRRKSLVRVLQFTLAIVVSAVSIAACGMEHGDPALTQNVYLELVDWHVAGLWVINSPVAWVRVANYNKVPITDVKFEYSTYDYENKELNKDTYTIEGSVAPGSVKNFIELYLGCVDLNSQKLNVKLLSVRADEHGH